MRAQKLAVIVGCGKSKREFACKVPIWKLYDSDYFQKKYRYAELFAADLGISILSAEHGLVEPRTYVDHYDTTLRDLSREETEEWAADVAHDLRAFPARDWYDDVVILAGRDYVEPLAEPLERLIDESMMVFDPFFNLGGIGTQKQWLKKSIDARDPLLDDAMLRPECHPDGNETPLMDAETEFDSTDDGQGTLDDFLAREANP
jgi:hypothetical protein